MLHSVFLNSLFNSGSFPRVQSSPHLPLFSSVRGWLMVGFFGHVPWHIPRRNNLGGLHLARKLASRLTIQVSCSFVKGVSLLRALFVGDFTIFILLLTVNNDNTAHVKPNVKETSPSEQLIPTCVKISPTSQFPR